MNFSTSRSDWSVYRPQNTRGDLGASSDSNDSRTSVGGQESSTPTARIQDSKTQRWNSTADDEGYTWDWNFAAQYVITVSRNKSSYHLLYFTSHYSITSYHWLPSHI